MYLYTITTILSFVALWISPHERWIKSTTVLTDTHCMMESLTLATCQWLVMCPWDERTITRAAHRCHLFNRRTMSIGSVWCRKRLRRCEYSFRGKCLHGRDRVGRIWHKLMLL